MYIPMYRYVSVSMPTYVCIGTSFLRKLSKYLLKVYVYVTLKRIPIRKSIRPQICKKKFKGGLWVLKELKLNSYYVVFM